MNQPPSPPRAVPKTGSETKSAPLAQTLDIISGTPGVQLSANRAPITPDANTPPINPIDPAIAINKMTSDELRMY
jgi:hypothetical protein